MLAEVEGDESLGGEPLVFDPVWLIRERPRPNLNPPRFLAPGRLVIARHRGEFGPSSATLVWRPARNDIHLRMDDIVGVSRQRYGWGLFPRFVAIRYRTSHGEAVAYFNDGGWKGWRPLLTRSNQRMMDAIQERVGFR